MAYLLILTGQRADDVVELNPAATLTVGSSTEAHIRLPEADVAAIHGQVYPAQGSYWFQDLGQGHSYLNMDPIANGTHVLSAHDVLAFGRTFVKFVTEPPRASRAVDRSPELSARDAEIEQLRAQVAQLEAHDEENRGELAGAREEVEQLRAELEAARAALRAQEADRESAPRLSVSPLVFERSDEASRIEGELATLRGRASDLAAALAMSGSGPR